MSKIKRMFIKYIVLVVLILVEAMGFVAQARQPKLLNMQKMVFYYSKNHNEYWLAATSIDESTRCGPFDTNNVHVMLDMGNENKINISNDDLKIVCLGTLYRPELTRNLTLFKFNLVIDNSQSIDPVSLKFVQDTLTRFINNIPIVYEAQVIRFSEVIQVKSPFLKNKNQIIQHINQPLDQGRTALFDAIMLGVRELMASERKVPLKFTVVLTDGMDNSSSIGREAFKSQIVNLCRQNSIPLFIVGVTNEVDSPLLEEISKFGMYQHIQRFPNIDRAFDLITNVIKDTYIIKMPAKGRFDPVKWKPSRISLSIDRNGQKGSLQRPSAARGNR
jgi:hypothetical protein